MTTQQYIVLDRRYLGTSLIKYDGCYSTLKAAKATVSRVSKLWGTSTSCAWDTTTGEVYVYDHEAKKIVKLPTLYPYGKN